MMENLVGSFYLEGVLTRGEKEKRGKQSPFCSRFGCNSM